MHDGYTAEPEAAVGVDQAGEETAAPFAIGVGLDEIGVGLNFYGETREVIGFAGQDGGNFGALKDFCWLRSGIRGAAGGFIFGSGGNGARGGFDLLGAFLEGVMEEVGAELRVEEVEGDGGHGEEEDHRHDGDEEVSDDEAVAQAPEEAFADEGEEAEEKIDVGDDEEEGDQAGEGRLDFDGFDNFVEDVEDDEEEGDAVGPGEAAEDAASEFEFAGHEGPF